MLQALLFSDWLQGLLRPGAAGELHSVFDRVCNAVVDGELVSILSPALGMQPQGLQVAAPPAGFVLGLGWRAGMAVRVGEGHLTVSTHRQGPVRVDWTGAARWSPEPPPLPQVLDRPALAANAARLAGALARAGTAGGMFAVVQAAGLSPAGSTHDLAWRQAAGTRVRLLLRALARGDGEAAAAPAAALVGLGPGFTPAGDDFLVGLAATLVLAARWQAAGPGLHAAAAPLATTLSVLGAKTTPVSAAFLAAAARGHLAEAPGLLLRDLFSQPGTAALRHLPRVLQSGYTSGTDLAAGIWAAMAKVVAA